jgi:IS30 family transposase
VFVVELLERGEMVDKYKGKYIMPFMIKCYTDNMDLSRTDKCYDARYLTLDDRIVIANLHDKGYNYSYIANKIGRHRKTVSYEIRRIKESRDNYNPYLAHFDFLSKLDREKQAKVIEYPKLLEFIKKETKTSLVLIRK